MIQRFTFNEIEVNTYVLFDESKECVIIDAGCNNEREKATLSKFITDNELKFVGLYNTHGHFDHIMGNAYVKATYHVSPQMHRKDLHLVEIAESYVGKFGLRMDTPPVPTTFLEDNQVVRFGNSELKVIHTPGHSSGGVCFYCEKEKYLVAGDTLFNGSIGRTDLGDGDLDEQLSSIRTKLLTLPSDTIVYPGHGPRTTIGTEALHNPFLVD